MEGVNMLKRCSKCKIEKESTEFFRSGKHKSGKEKFRGDCRECAQKQTVEWRVKNRSHYNNYSAMWRDKNPDKQHKTDIKRRYGLSIEDYNRMLTTQNMGCKICGKQHDPSVKRGRLYVDHDHKTGAVRGLLCMACNSMIGRATDDISILEKAIEYLKS
jgi:hypothetical protein